MAAIDCNANAPTLPAMATLNIRNLPDEVHRRLRVRAAEHGRSMEAEARAILSAACATKASRRCGESAMARAKASRTFIDKLYGGANRRTSSTS